MKRPFCAAAFAASLSVAFVPSVVDAQPVGIATMPAGTFTYSAAAAIAKVLVDHAKLRTVVQAQAGNRLAAVASGDADFAVSNSFDGTFYAQGSGYYKGEGPHPNVRTVGVFQSFKIAIFVRKGSPINTIHDLKGKNFASGFGAQKSAEFVNTALLANGGLSYDDVNKVKVPNVSIEAQDFDSGTVDALMFAAGSAAVKQAAATVGGVRALPLDTSPEAIKRLQAILPGGYVVHLNPSPRFDGILKPTPLLAYHLVLYTSTKTPDDVVYQAAKALYENKAELAATFAPFKEFNTKAMGEPVKGVPTDPGALKFYKEIGVAPQS